MVIFLNKEPVHPLNAPSKNPNAPVSATKLIPELNPMIWLI